MPAIAPTRIEIGLKPRVFDARGAGVAAAIRDHLALGIDDVRTTDFFTFNVEFADGDLERVRRDLTDPVIQRSAAPRLDDPPPFDWLVWVGFKPGVTDNVGRTARTVLGDLLGRHLAEEESVHTSTGYYLRGNLTREQAQHIGRDLLANLLIESLEIISRDEWEAGEPGIVVPKVTAETRIEVLRYDLGGSDEDLMRISREGTLALSLEEMKAIRDYFMLVGDDPTRRKLGLDHQPTDVELEMLAQTWSEHCKHKIFAADIEYTDEEGRTETIHGLFKTFIKGATAEVAKKRPWLVSVFEDDAGVIEFNERIDLAFKVETHNSPSALEPYGGAMTGIVGCNRDLLGTGMSSELLINVWGYCFADPHTAADRIPEGVMHPARLRDGVHKGVIDGGNQSGIPYGVGWEFFDERYLAKPLVYCGSVGLLPRYTPDGRRAGAKQRARAGDHIVMVGGRIGKDGIHGATFSSEELHKDSPVQAVQIGDPITQKKMSDFLLDARRLGLFSAITDNGAGGLSSSVGEMATDPGGARVDLSQAPLKYAGLQPWEIWLSEAQERMTLAVPPAQLEAIKDLAARRDVELSVLGEFNDSGKLHLQYGEQTVGWIGMEFLHDGCPRMRLRAHWKPPLLQPVKVPMQGELATDLRLLLGRLNIASKEQKSRQYDHEVKGRTVIKPFVGKRRDVPSDATVFLAEHGGREGIVLSRGFNSHLGDLDCYAMIGWALDEAIRRILAVGGRLDLIAALDNFCWPDPVLSPSTPDGPYKLAQLVRANQAFRDYCVAFGVPLISGKDSMKNDSTRGGRKISIPPSVLISAIGKIDDVSRAVTMDVKLAGDVVYVIGETRGEMGGTEYAFARAKGSTTELEGLSIGGAVPKIDADALLKVYAAAEGAIAAGEVRSMHAPTLGGLGVGLALVAMGGELGLDVSLENLPRPRGTQLCDAELLFSESAGRFIATVPIEKVDAFESRMRGIPHGALGYVVEDAKLTIRNAADETLVDEPLADLKSIWQNALD